MTFQAILLAIINVLGVFLAYVVFRNNPKNKLNICFGLMVICMLLWVNFSFLGYAAKNVYFSEFYFKINFGSVILAMMLAYMFFVVYFLKNRNVLLDFLVSILSLSLVVVTMTTDCVIQGVKLINGQNEIIFGNCLSLFNGFGIFLAILIFGYMSIRYIKASSKERVRLNYFFAGIILYAIMNVIFNVIIPIVFGSIEYSWVGDYSVIIFLGLTGYTIVSKGLFDIKLAILRSVTYMLVIATLSIVYIAVSFLISNLIFSESMSGIRQTIVGIVEGLVMIAVFQPIVKFFNKITDKFFYKDHYNEADFYTDINKCLASTVDLRNLLERTSEIIKSALKSEQVFLFIYANDDRFVSDGTERHKHLPKYDVDQINVLNGGSSGLIVADRLDKSDQIRRIMVSHRLEIILPLIQDNETLGFLCLGENKTSEYMRRDYKVLRVISNSLIVAIRNALTVDEVRELNETLKQRINNATKELRSSNRSLLELDKVKDDFIGIASHQLRTPLTSIKGYLSMVLEGDVGKINDSQKEMLSEAFTSSERMVRLINDFLNVSRLQTGKFTVERQPLDLVKIIERELDNLGAISSARGIKYIFKKPKKFPVMNLDEEKIRQVIMNFADNAMYYSRDNSHVDVRLAIEKKEIIFTVKDTGIGVPKAEQHKLFDKFFRATNARKQRPDGTGVGLYLAKKIIEAHGGKIIFESVEGKGSTFGFRLKIND